jgi:hypothetical protein
MLVLNVLLAEIDRPDDALESLALLRTSVGDVMAVGDGQASETREHMASGTREVMAWALRVNIAMRMIELGGLEEAWAEVEPVLRRTAPVLIN